MSSQGEYNVEQCLRLRQISFALGDVYRSAVDRGDSKTMLALPTIMAGVNVLYDEHRPKGDA